MTSGLDAVRAITFDFGNTLVPVDRASLGRVVEVTAEHVAARLGPFDRAAFLAVWGEERDRQFREEVPRFREVDLAQRFVRVVARLRGLAPPDADTPWDDQAAAARSEPDEIAWAIDVYSRSFVTGIPPPAFVEPFLARLSGCYRLGILSNWPVAATIDRYAEAAGWTRHLAAITVSQRVGVIKPHPAIFRAAQRELGVGDPGRMLHVGDDWVPDVVGGREAGWHVAYLRVRPLDSPLPGSERDRTVQPDLELDSLAELEAALPTAPRCDTDE